MSVIAKCDSCSHVFDVDESESPLYECGNCGTRFTRENSLSGDGHQCPDCNKFGSKVTDWACPDCGEGEGVETEAFKCPDCDEWKALEDGEMSEGVQPKVKAEPLAEWEVFDLMRLLRLTMKREDREYPWTGEDGIKRAEKLHDHLEKIGKASR